MHTLFLLNPAAGKADCTRTLPQQIAAAAAGAGLAVAAGVLLTAGSFVAAGFFAVTFSVNFNFLFANFFAPFAL